MVVAPGTATESARAVGVGHQRDAARQADLTAVGMSAQHQIETGVGGQPVGFRRMRQQNGDGLRGMFWAAFSKLST